MITHCGYVCWTLAQRVSFSDRALSGQSDLMMRWCSWHDEHGCCFKRTDIGDEVEMVCTTPLLPQLHSEANFISTRQAIPESYIYLLSVQCVASLCGGFASFIGSLYTSVVVQRPRAAGDPVIHGPPAFDLASLPPDDLAIRPLRSALFARWSIMVGPPF